MTEALVVVEDDLICGLLTHVEKIIITRTAFMNDPDPKGKLEHLKAFITKALELGVLEKVEQYEDLNRAIVIFDLKWRKDD